MFCCWPYPSNWQLPPPGHRPRAVAKESVSQREQEGRRQKWGLLAARNQTLRWFQVNLSPPGALTLLKRQSVTVSTHRWFSLKMQIWTLRDRDDKRIQDHNSDCLLLSNFDPCCSFLAARENRKRRTIKYSSLYKSRKAKLLFWFGFLSSNSLKF